jgi:RND family efflux transporter MFP subunit
MKSYRTAFFVMLAASVVLAAGLGIVWWRSQHGGAERAAPAATAMPLAPEMAEHAAHNAATAPSVEARLAEVQISPERLQRIGVKTAEVQRKAVHSEIRTVGNVEVNERRIAYVQLRYPGWIQKVFVDSTYDFVRKGQPLFTIYSPDLVTSEQEYLIAKRNQATMAQSSVPGVASGSASLLEAAAERLRRWQVPAREIEKLEATGQVQQNLEVDSPVTGFITERNAVPNQYVQPETRLYTVADLSTVWVYAAVFQSDIGQLQAGDAATITTDAYPGRRFSGRVDFIWPQVDMTTRTVRVRLVFANPGLRLKPGMFVNVTVEVALGRQLTRPASGVLQSGTRSIVFVDHGGGRLEPREVELGAQAGEEYIVRQGLKEGEKVITSANFLIDSESQLQAAMGAFAAPVPGAGAVGSAAAPAAQEEARVEFSTQPEPARKGDNIYRVQLKGADGAPVTGAQVSVRSYLAGMPQMGMPAMTVVTALAEKGTGRYEGRARLESGGTWQITITAARQGGGVMTKQTSLTVEGGM